ncbi:MAG TPA: hypothetical protein EYP65_08535 [Armatimonadetes bacterium]|nr:hypothetical protein [Armatimonadota bacterium]
MDPRTRRLIADYEKMLDAFTGHPYVVVEPLGGYPPERYRVTYKVKGLRPGRRGPMVAETHQVEIYLHHDYPRLKPKCVALTPIFHPNFSPEPGGIICIGDHWAAGETLVDVVVQIGDMIQFKKYNVNSALNPHAARWALANEHSLPIDNKELYPPEPEIEVEGLGEQKAAGEPPLDLTEEGREEPEPEIELW